jgi:hypothetical protein
MFIERKYFEDSSVLRRIVCTNFSEKVTASIFREYLVNVFFQGHGIASFNVVKTNMRASNLAKSILVIKTTTTLFI